MAAMIEEIKIQKMKVKIGTNPAGPNLITLNTLLQPTIYTWVPQGIIIIILVLSISVR